MFRLSRRMNRPLRCPAVLLFHGALALSNCWLFPSPAHPAKTSPVPLPTSTPTDEQVQTSDAIDPRTRNLAGDDERFRPEKQRKFSIGEILVTVTGAIRFDADLEDNFNLRSTKKRDEASLTPRSNLNFIFDFPQGFSLFTEFRIEDDVKLEEGKKPRNTFQLQFRDFFGNFPLPFQVPTILRIGRQQFFEPRRWLFNDRLDAIRLFLAPKPFKIEFAFSTPVPDSGNRIRVFDNIFETRRQADFIVYGTMTTESKTTIGGYAIVRNDASSTDENPFWIGGRVFGKSRFKFGESPLLRPKIRFWFDAAFVGGTIKAKDIRGFAVDIGGTYILRKVPFTPYGTLAYGFGSGDGNTSDGVDRNFRQTGFHGNSGKFGGVVNFDYYGVVIDPELSNVHVYTAGIGFRPSPKSSVDVVYHHYAQDSASDEFRDFDLGTDPRGRNTDLGQEIDVVLGYREIQNMRIRLRSGYFIPGKAFGSRDDPAFGSQLDVQFSF